MHLHALWYMLRCVVHWPEGHMHILNVVCVWFNCCILRPAAIGPVASRTEISSSMAIYFTYGIMVFSGFGFFDISINIAHYLFF